MTLIGTHPHTRKGILGTKLGMTQVFDANNRIVPVTVIQAGPCAITLIRTLEKMDIAQFKLHTVLLIHAKLLSHLLVTLPRPEVTPRRSVAEIRLDDVSTYEVGGEINADIFAAGDLVDVTGTSTGKGTAGVMKRHGFGGLGASHGVDRKHRTPGSIGACSTPGRVFKGIKMAGRMGNEKVTTQSLTLHAVDTEKGYLLIKGSVPGPIGGLILVRAAAKAGA